MQQLLTRPRIALLLIVGVVGVIIVSLLGAKNAQLATMNLVVAPSDATTTVDGAKKQYQAGIIKLSPGKHTLTVSRDGFASRTVTVTLSKASTLKEQVELTPNSATGTNYLQENQSEAYKSEAIGDAATTAGSADLTKKYPILSFLPVNGDGYSVNIGESHATPKNDFALYVSCWRDQAYCQQQVTDWMTKMGFVPADYEYVYLNNNNS